MKKYLVAISQTLIGHVEIEAENEGMALQIMEDRYLNDGKALPDMDDVNELKFTISKKEHDASPCRYFSRFGEFCGCSCNNDPDEQGECIYESGYPLKTGQIDCKFYC